MVTLVLSAVLSVTVGATVTCIGILYRPMRALERELRTK